MRQVFWTMVLIILGAGAVTSFIMEMEDIFWFKSPKYRNKKILEERCKSGDCKDTNSKYPDAAI